MKEGSEEKRSPLFVQSLLSLRAGIFLLSAPFLSVSRMLITIRMTLSWLSSQKSSPIYSAFVAAHFFSDKFNYARRLGVLSPSPSLPRARFLRDG